MTWEELVVHGLGKPGAWADEPWEGDQVVKVGKKIFLFCGSPDSDPHTLTVRCPPGEVEAWRQRYPESIGPAPYLGARAWNRVVLDGSVPEDDLLTLVDDSYDSVVAGLPKRDRPAGWAPGQTG
jgi:predicted DNA-binding protein (MmcQ/YjbR family)